MWCYLFEANSIQRWIFSGGKLRDAVAGSSLLDRVCSWSGGDFFGEAMDACGLDPKALNIARRAGGGLCVYHEEREVLARLRAVFTLKLRAATPDLSFADGLAEGADMPEARSKAMAAQRALRNGVSADPFRAGPFHRVAPRTGRPAVARKDGEFLDAGLAAKRDFKKTQENHDLVGGRFASDGLAAWPLNMSPEKGEASSGAVFPFLGENRAVGLTHADGNGMGRLLVKLDAALKTDASLDYAASFRDFSTAISQATRAAAQEATAALKPEIKDGVWPFRPIILGGDDLTAILRGDVAIRFTEVFLTAFKTQTRAAFDGLKSRNKFWTRILPDHLSAGAGIVFLQAGQPFDQAYDFCASLAKFAKDRAKEFDAENPPSLIAFHRLTSGEIPEAWGEVVSGLQAGQVHLTMNPYAVEAEEAERFGLPSLAALRGLREVLTRETIGRGPARRLTSAFFESDWRANWARMRKIMGERAPKDFGDFEAALQALGCAGGPVAGAEGGATPLLDALNWSAAAKGGEHV